MKPTVLYIQNRTHRAGAQTCLMRLLRTETIRKWNPVLVCSPGGWLPGACKQNGIAVIEQEFPHSRSLAGILYANRAFARRVARELRARNIFPSIVHANDHQEGLLGLALAKELDARSAIFLRSSGMTARDYEKYRCKRYDFIAAAGEALRENAKHWSRSKPVVLIHDGIAESEFLPEKPKPENPPSRVLVLGTGGVAKGWADLTAALHILEEKSVALPEAFDFTDSRPNPAENNLKLERLTKVRCNFLGRADAFRDLVRSYNLVINPSRMESFGMAAIEVLAAGVPLLSSRTGVIGQVQENPAMLFSPSDPASLASALEVVLSRWAEIDFGVERAQALIREKFLIDRAAEKLDAAYRGLIGKD